MSNLVGTAIIVTAGLGSMSYMAYSTFNTSGNGGGDGLTENVITVQLPQFNESVKFNVLSTEKEMVTSLKSNRVVYDDTELSYSLLVGPGKCEVFVLLKDLSQVISDYEILKCQRMFAKATK